MTRVPVLVNDTDFFLAFIDKKQDPVYYALAEMHDVLVREKALMPPEEAAPMIAEIKMLLTTLIKSRG